MRVGIFLVLAWALAGCSDPTDDVLARGANLSFLGDHRAAVELYQSHLLGLEAEDPESADERAQVRLVLGRLQRTRLADVTGALESFQAAAAIKPGPVLETEARLETMRILRDLRGQPGPALAELEICFSLTPDLARDPQTRTEAARLALAAGDYERALEHARAALGRTRDTDARISLWFLTATAHLVMDRPGEALVAFRRVLREPARPRQQERARFEIARIYDKLGRTRDALALYEANRGAAPSASWVTERIHQLEADLTFARSGTSIRP